MFRGLMDTNTNPLPHLVDATTALRRALQDFDSGTSPAVRQDGLEHLAEIEALTELLITRTSPTTALHVSPR